MISWHRDISRQQWRTLFAAQLGWILDAMDVMLYSFALTAIRTEFHLTSAMAGALAAAPLLTSAIGGALFGYLSDRFGRTRALTWSILTFSAFTAFTATSHTVTELVFWRAVVGIGLGGEWAVGAVLVAESWPERHRAKGIGLMQSGWAIGYLIAAILAGMVLPRWGWRPLFLLGILPALSTWWIRRSIPEPPDWQKHGRSASPPVRKLFQPPLLRHFVVLTLTASSVLFAYWGLFTWIPTYLSTPIERGGAGLTIMKSSAWIFPLQAGAFLGYISFGFIADRIGRRPAFLTFVLATAALVPVYGLWGRNVTVLLAISPLLGFFGHGYFSAFGVIMAELFPPEIRTTAQGLVYNIGRAFSAFAPVTIGALADRHGIGSALGFTTVFFITGAALMLLVPEPRKAPAS